MRASVRRTRCNPSATGSRRNRERRGRNLAGLLSHAPQSSSRSPRIPMECTVCSRSLADDVGVEAVRAARFLRRVAKASLPTTMSPSSSQSSLPSLSIFTSGPTSVPPNRAARMPRGDSGRCSHRSKTRSTPFASSPRSRRSPSRHRTTCIRSQTERRSSVIPPWCDRDRAARRGRSGRSPTGRCHSATVVSASSLPGCTSLDHAWIELDEESWSQSAFDPRS